MKQGRIIKKIADLCFVEIEDKVYECKSKGIFRRQKISPTVGDIVGVEIIGEEKGNISKISPRNSYLIRPNIANITQLVIVVSTDGPKPDLLLLDKQILFAKTNNLKPIVCISKTDLDKQTGKEIGKTYTSAGIELITTSFVGADSISAREKRSIIPAKNSTKQYICIFWQFRGW